MKEYMEYTGQNILGDTVHIELEGYPGAYGTEYLIRVQFIEVHTGLKKHEALKKFYALFNQLTEIKKTATIRATR